MILAELITRIQLRKDGEPALHGFHPVAVLLSYLTKVGGRACVCSGEGREAGREGGAKCVQGAVHVCFLWLGRRAGCKAQGQTLVPSQEKSRRWEGCSVRAVPGLLALARQPLPQLAPFPHPARSHASRRRPAGAAGAARHAGG